MTMNKPSPMPHPQLPFTQEMAERHARHNNASIFLLADGARLMQNRRPDRFSLEPRFGVSLALDDPDHDAHAAGPLLFELDWATWCAGSRAQTLEALFVDDVCSVLVSPMPIQALAHHLRRHLDVTLADGTDMLMRFFDPRVLPFWLAILPASHLADLGAAVMEWGFFDHQRQLCWQAPDESSGKSGEASFPLEITTQQEDKLMQQCLPYALLDRLLSDPGSLLDVFPQAERYECVANSIEKAQSHGFDGMADLENFCRLGLEYGFDFDQRAPMKRMLVQQHKPGHVHELMAQFTDDDFKEMKV